MGRYLIVTWDGAGNLAPTLGITRTLVERGHDVRVIGHDTIVERCGDVGARFVPLTQAAGWDAMEDPDDFEAEITLMIEELCFSTTIARDLAQELDREPADAVLVDSTAPGVVTVRGRPARSAAGCVDGPSVGPSAVVTRSDRQGRVTGPIASQECSSVSGVKGGQGPSRHNAA